MKGCPSLGRFDAVPIGVGMSRCENLLRPPLNSVEWPTEFMCWCSWKLGTLADGARVGNFCYSSILGVGRVSMLALLEYLDYCICCSSSMVDTGLLPSY